MLCRLCETFLNNILHHDFSTWRRVKDGEGWFTFKHGDYATITAAAQAGCEQCSLFNQVRSEEIPNYESLDVKYELNFRATGAKAPSCDSYCSSWTFQLLTVAPEMSWIAFEIFRPNSTEILGIGRDDNAPNRLQEVSKDPTSSKTLRIAKGWIESCLKEHTCCSRPDCAPLPTRVIDVGYFSEQPSPRLQVNRGQLGQYLTLSHCWGTGSRLTLTERNLHAFEQAIPFEQLPRTFQDAIKLTVLLGMRYLWIDALCIVQDDQNDWRKESASMCAVFENALFSISALSANDSHSGILHERAPEQVTTSIGGIQLGVRKRLDSLSEAVTKSRLETRAWCYQERLLPKAVLHIAPTQIYWECRKCTSSEAFPTETEPRFPGFTTYLKSNSHIPNTMSRDGFGKNWLPVVSCYSERKVTRASDRLPAIAGLADKAKKEFGAAVYMQGLWSNDLHAGLLWRRQVRVHGLLIPSRDRYLAHASGSMMERPRRRIASSWSWASINDGARYSVCQQYGDRSLSSADAVFGSYDAPGKELLDCSDGTLQLEGLVKRGSCKPSTNTSRDPDEATFRPSGSVLAVEGLVCYLDYANDPVSKSCYCLRIASWKQPSIKGKKKASKDQERVFYLVLERTGHNVTSGEGEIFGAFKRIGMGYDVRDKVDKIFANAERRRLQLV